MRNKSGFRYTLAAVFDVRTTFYTGTSHSLVKKDRQETKVAPKSGAYFSDSWSIKIRKGSRNKQNTRSLT